MHARSRSNRCPDAFCIIVRHDMRLRLTSPKRGRMRRDFEALSSQRPSEQEIANFPKVVMLWSMNSRLRRQKVGASIALRG